MNLSKNLHDEAISGAVAATIELGDLTEKNRLLIQRKISDHGLGLRSMENDLEFLFLAAFYAVNHVNQTHISQLQQNSTVYTIQGDSGLGRQLADALSILHKLPSMKLQE